ncbi:MAG: right-handed parallel beta-helix repeat-containing protein, partial [Planctomycetota bacterium]
RIITVDDDAPADFNNIQAAIDDANDGDTVEIQPGTYTGPGNYNIRYSGKAITVRGTNPEDFDIVAATVIDCNSQGRGFIFESGEGPSSILSGVTVTDAYYYEGSGSGGAAVSCTESSPVITNCILTGNFGQGGGVGAREGGLVVRNCIITRNRSPRYGGGIYTTLLEEPLYRCG